MKQFIVHASVVLFVLCGFLTASQLCNAAAPEKANIAAQSAPVQNPQPAQKPQVVHNPAQVNPAIGSQAPVSTAPQTYTRRVYTRSDIRSLPIVARPNRPGHFIGNTVRRRAGVGY